MKLRRKQIRGKGKTNKATANKGKKQNKRRKLIREKGKTKGEILSRLFSFTVKSLIR